MRRALLAAAAALLTLAPPASAQLSTASSWPQVGHDAGLTKRTFVTASQTGTPAQGFPAPLSGGAFANPAGSVNAGPPVVYQDGNLIAGTNAPSGVQGGPSTPTAQLAYINAADVSPPGAARPLFSDTGPFPFPSGLAATPAVSTYGLMFAPSSSGHLWIVPPSGPASSAFPFPANTGPVGPPTVGPNGIIYVTAGADADNPFSTGSLFAINPDSGQTIFQVGSSSATQPVALDGAGNVYIDNNGGLEQLNANGNVRWGFNPPGPPQVLSPPMVYGSTAYVTAGPRLGVQQGHLFAVAISTATGKQLWATPIQGSFQNQSFGPALGGSGNVIVQTSNVLTALNRTTGQVAWTEQLVNGNAMVEPMVDGSGDVYVMGNAASGGGGYAQGFSASGQSLWEENFGTPSPFGTFGSPTGGAIGVDGSVYVSATDGKVYAFTDPS